MTDTALSLDASRPTADESKIAAMYRRSGRALPIALALGILCGIAYVSDTKYVAAVGIAMMVGVIGHIDARLFDLAVRLRRATELLAANHN